MVIGTSDALSGEESNINPAFQNSILETMLQQVNLGQPTFDPIAQGGLPIPAGILATPEEATASEAPDPNAAGIENLTGSLPGTPLNVPSPSAPLGTSTVGPAGTEGLSQSTTGSSATGTAAPSAPLASPASGGGPATGSAATGSSGAPAATSAPATPAPGSQSILQTMLAQIASGNQNAGNASGFGNNTESANFADTGPQDNDTDPGSEFGNSQST